jgi:hypothetical protein
MATFTRTGYFLDDVTGVALKRVPVVCIQVSDGSTVGTTTTDADGKYVFSGLDTAVDYRFEARYTKVQTQAYSA